MKAEIITINSDLLRGQVMNTNTIAFLTRQLAGLGISVHRMITLKNSSEDLKQILELAEKCSDLIIFSGGLDSDADNSLKRSVAEYLKAPLEKYTGSEEYFFYQHKNNTYILLPEPFDELKAMFLKNTRPLIIEKILNDPIIETQIYSVYGLTLAQLNEQLSDLIAYAGNPFVDIYYENDKAKIQITTTADSKKEAKKLTNTVAKKIRGRIDQYIFSERDERLVHIVKRLLKEQGKKITAAESLTGGSFLKVISGEPGSSDIFEGGVVSYSDDIKTNVLGVSKETIEHYGVVSPQCAIEMAENSMEIFNADISISLTGVAGPASLEGKVPGTVWIGLAQKGQKTFAKKFHFGHKRERNRKNSVLSALNLVQLALLGKPIENQIYFSN